MIKDFVKRIVFGKTATSDSYIKYLKKLGCKIGDGTLIYEPRNTVIDCTRPWLIEIGCNVKITRDVKILTHGFDFSVLLNYYGELYGSAGMVRIGDNVFIGMGTTILKGVTVGSNVIIGANSLVNKNIPDNCVAAGNPAKVIMTLEEYRLKRQKEYINEMKNMAIEYRKRYGVNPGHIELREFFPTYLQRDRIEQADSLFISNAMLKDNFLRSQPIYNGIEEFLKECKL